MMVPILNKSGKEVLLVLEPEGDTVPLAPGQTVVVKATGEGSQAAHLEVDIGEGFLAISMMCQKEVWCGDVRLR
jgi:hypothetical protein